MNTRDQNELTCRVCCKEIPLDAAFTPEGVHYVIHFCGLECYQRLVAERERVSIIKDLGTEGGLS